MFCLASVSLEDNEAAVLADFLGDTQSNEIHFSRLRRRKKGRKRVLEFLNQPQLTTTAVKLSVFHKRFAITAWIVDYLIEPLYAHAGVDLYKGSASLSLANILHITLPTLFGEDDYLIYQQKFLSMIRSRNQAAVDGFYGMTRELLRRSPISGARDLLGTILATETKAPSTLAQLGVTAVDPAIPSFFMHCSAWTAELGQPFTIVHDDSKPIRADAENLRSYMSTDSQPKLYGYGVRSAWLPLQVRDLKFETSTESLQIQLADVIAGSALTFFRGKLLGTDDDFVEAIDDSRLPQLLFHGVWPTPEKTPQEFIAESKGGQNLLDQLASLRAAR